MSDDNPELTYFKQSLKNGRALVLARRSLGKTSVIRERPVPEPGFAVWGQGGEWFTAPQVDPAQFGDHDYMRESGTGNCLCGCCMTRSLSFGPVDPFGPCPMNPTQDELYLRDILGSDLAVFFAQQCDAEAIAMAAFTAKDPMDRDAFLAHWDKIWMDETVAIQTIVHNHRVIGHVMSYLDEEEDCRCEVTYWLGKEFWGRGLASRALGEFLVSLEQTRPLYARTARDNMASRRVLEKNGFPVIGESMGFANARGEEIAELLWKLG
jgi:RimJ/RimL family protein N-acetyltransferase